MMGGGGRCRSFCPALRDPGNEAVYIATPHQFHADQAIAAAEAAKSVVVEKPMALSLEDCDFDDLSTARTTRST